MTATPVIDVCLPSEASSLTICTASSRVGASIMAWVPAFGSIFWSNGRPKAAVLPVPVLAWPRMSFPVSISGMSVDWM